MRRSGGKTQQWDNKPDSTNATPNDPSGITTLSDQTSNNSTPNPTTPPKCSNDSRILQISPKKIPVVRRDPHNDCMARIHYRNKPIQTIQTTNTPEIHSRLATSPNTSSGQKLQHQQTLPIMPQTSRRQTALFSLWCTIKKTMLHLATWKNQRSSHTTQYRPEPTPTTMAGYHVSKFTTSTPGSSNLLSKRVQYPVPPTSTNRMGSIICRTNRHVMGISTNPPLPTNEWHSLLCKGDPDHMGVHTRGVVWA